MPAHCPLASRTSLLASAMGTAHATTTRLSGTVAAGPAYAVLSAAESARHCSSLSRGLPCEAQARGGAISHAGADRFRRVTHR